MNNYGIYLKKKERAFTEKETELIKDMTEEIKQYPDSEHVHNDKFDYYFCRDVQDNINGVAIIESYEKEATFLSKIYVEPFDRKQGIASFLLTTILEEYKTIECGIHETNIASKNLFKNIFSAEHLCEYIRIERPE